MDIQKRYFILVLIILFLSACGSGTAPAATVESSQAVPAPSATPEVTAVETEEASLPDTAATPTETQTPRTDTEVQTELPPQETPTEMVPVLEGEDDIVRLRLGEPSTDMQMLVRKLAQDEVISTAEGHYFQMDDLILRWAQINWYKAWFSPIAPDDFVVRADLKWFAASKNANTFNSGCGFAFHASDRRNHYMAFIATDGYVYLWRVIRGRPAVLGMGWYNFYTAGEKDEAGIWVSDATFVLAVEGKKFTFFVNGEEIMTRYDPVLEEGNLAVALASGINSGFGTQCEFTNTEIFVLESTSEGQ
jgi:hypothetical protein